MELEEKLKKVEESVKTRATTSMLSEMRKDLEMKIDSLRDELNHRSDEYAGTLDELRKEIESLKKEILDMEKKRGEIEEAVDGIRKYMMRYEKLSRRLRTIEEIMGVEEEIDVNKVPPSILRLVYQYTLNDAISMLRKYVGPGEAERIIGEVLQDVRTKTSGTELFKLKDGKIEAGDVEKAIKKRLISPKQIHLTYVEIINKIKEYLPGYIPKNFASLLRTKGQEYAIETSTENRIRIEMLERSVGQLRSEMAYQENILREDIAEIKRMNEMDLRDLKNYLEERFSGIEVAIESIGEEIRKIYDTLDRINPYLENYRYRLYREIEGSIPAEGIPVDNLGYHKVILKEFLDEGVRDGRLLIKDNVVYPVPKIKERILALLEDGAKSFSHIKKETGYDKEVLVTVLDWMRDEGLIEEKKYGKGKKYIRR